MYKVIVLVVCSVLGGLAYGQKKQPGFVIDGKITGKDTGMVYLEHAGERKSIDSMALKNGVFSFKGKVASPVLYTLHFSGVENGASLYVENSHIGVSANADAMRAFVVTGSVSDSVYREFWSRFGKRNKEGISVNLRLNKLYNATQPDSNERAAVEDSFRIFIDGFNGMVETFIREYPFSPVAAYVIEDRMINFGEIELSKKFYALLKPSATHSYYGDKVRDALALAAKSEVGTKVQFAQADTSGKMVKLEDIKAKYILIDFWASWCGPCRRENPNMVEAYKKYHDRGFDIIGISLDNNKTLWLNAIHKDSLTWTHVSDMKAWENSVALKYGIKVVPTSFLVDQEGKIVAKNLRGRELHKKLEILLEQ